MRALTDQVQKLSAELGTCKSLYEAERTTAARVGADLECAREEHSAAYQHLQQQVRPCPRHQHSNEHSKQRRNI